MYGTPHVKKPTMPREPNEHIKQVERYYQRNTEAFLRLGENEGVPAIHIALWPEGTETVAEAMEVAHQLILEIIQDLPLHRVADLACGMGAALAHLDRHLSEGVELYGLTLGTPILGSKTSDRIQIQRGDFHEADTLLPPCSVAFCIEAMAQSDEPERFFAAAGRLLEPGGRLIVIDDVMMHTEMPSTALQTYRAHWLAPGVQPLGQLTRWAANAGLTLTSSKDLTPWVRLGRPRDRSLRWTRPLWGWLSHGSQYAKSLSGGDARQRCLETGETQFQILEFVRE
jgi:cyclopropane fatty-acyl-phospholipid synthase-like methyltransferase